MKQANKPKLQTIKEIHVQKHYLKNTRTDIFKPRNTRHQSLQEKIQAFSRANDNLFKIKKMEIQNKHIQKMKSAQQKRLKLPHLIMKKNPNSQIIDPKSTRDFPTNPSFPLQTLDSTTTSKLYFQVKKIGNRILPPLPSKSSSFFGNTLPRLTLDELQLQDQKQLKKNEQNPIIQALWKTKSMLVCIKQIKIKANNLIDIRHNNFIKIFGTLQIGNKSYAITGQEARYSLKSLVEQFGLLSESLVSQIMKQLVQGIKQLHYHKIYHNKLTLDNIFYDASGKILIDISSIEQDIKIQTMESIVSNFSNNISDYQKTYTKSVFSEANYGVFINYYNPPQSLIPSNSRYCQINKDIWSLGCIALQLLHGSLDRRNKNHPYNFTIAQMIKNNISQNAAQLIEQINQQFQPIDYSQQSDNYKQFFSLSDQMQQFVKHCLTVNSEQRPVIWELAMFSLIKN